MYLYIVYACLRKTAKDRKNRREDDEQGRKRKIERGAANRSNYTDTGEEFADQSRPSCHEHEQQHPRALDGDLEAQVAFAGRRCRRRRSGPRLADQDRWGRGIACRRASSPVRMSTSCVHACVRARARASEHACAHARGTGET